MIMCLSLLIKGYGEVGAGVRRGTEEKTQSPSPKSMSDLSIKPHEYEQGPLKGGLA